MKSICVRAGLAKSLVSALHQPEKEAAARNAPPYRASVATTPVLRPHPIPGEGAPVPWGFLDLFLASTLPPPDLVSAV